MIIAFIILCSSVAIYYISMRFISQVYYFRASDFVKKESFGLAKNAIKKAIYYQPKDEKLHEKSGEIYLKIAKLYSESEKGFNFLEKSRGSFLTALKLNPIYARAAYGVAKAEDLLIRWSEILKHDNKKYDPVSYYRLAIKLRPYGIIYNWDYTRFLAFQNKKKELPKAVEHLVFAFPPACELIKKEKFCSKEILAACINGLKKAASMNIRPKDALSALSKIYQEAGNIDKAISFYKKSLQFSSHSISRENYLHIAMLCLMNDNLKDAEKYLFKVLKTSHDRDRDMKKIWGYYARVNRLSDFIRFYKKTSGSLSFFHETDILIARSLIKTGKPDEAKKFLKNFCKNQNSAEAYYLLYQIAVMEKDYKAMEKNIKMAAKLDPCNCRYFIILSTVLMNKKLYDQAEYAASKAIKCNRNFNFLAHRAEIRWIKGDAKGALADWTGAIKLNPGRADLYAKAAMAWQKLGRLKSAEKYYKKAMELDPANPVYSKQYGKTGS